MRGGGYLTPLTQPRSTKRKLTAMTVPAEQADYRRRGHACANPAPVGQWSAGEPRPKVRPNLASTSVVATGNAAGSSGTSPSQMRARHRGKYPKHIGGGIIGQRRTGPPASPYTAATDPSPLSRASSRRTHLSSSRGGGRGTRGKEHCRQGDGPKTVDLLSHGLKAHVLCLRFGRRLRQPFMLITWLFSVSRSMSAAVR